MEDYVFPHFHCFLWLTNHSATSLVLLVKVSQLQTTRLAQEPNRPFKRFLFMNYVYGNIPLPTIAQR